MTRAFLGLAAALGLLGCGTAAGVLLDLPDRPPPSATPEPLAGPEREEAPRVDTLPPPPIESVLDPDSVLKLLPRDVAGNVDWSAALREGIIRPRRGLPGSPEQPASGFGYDFAFGDFEVVFPHSSHVAWDGCQSCHPTLFRRPGQKITMAEINAGEACGRCHGPVAFPAETCERCHPSLSLEEGRMEAVLLGDLVMKRTEGTVGAGSYPPSLFPHWVHRIRYTCDTCHPQPFAPQSGEAVLTMEELGRGLACGACHDGRTAFGTMECARCHRPPDGAEGSEP